MTNEALTYQLTWDATDGKGAESATWGYLSIALGDHLLWGRRVAGSVQGIHWTWIDLLEHLAEVWPWLMWEEGWPAGPVFQDPADFLLSSKKWLWGLPSDDAAEEEDALLEFRHRHDLAMAVEGKFVPPLWAVRDGRRVFVAGEGHSASLDPEMVFSLLARLGDDIASRIEELGDERAVGAIDAWRRRLERDSFTAAAIAVGVGTDELNIIAQGSPATTFELDASQDPSMFRPNELLVAARMTVASTSLSVIQVILEQLRSVPVRSASALDELTSAAVAFMRVQQEKDFKPALAGNALARWLRGQLRISESERVDPDTLLKGWGVYLSEFSAKDGEIDAVGCWGPRHGPAVLVNVLGRHSADIKGRRSTLAHELAHLLVDRGDGLPLAEVLGGNVFPALEQRANAFAAELLLPRSIAGAEFRDTKDARKSLDDLAEKFGASREIVAWQAYNSGQGMVWDTFALLRQEVSHPARFLWRVAQGASFGDGP